MSSSPAPASSTAERSITHAGPAQPFRARLAAEIDDLAQPRRQGGVQGVIKDPPGHAPRRGIQGYYPINVSNVSRVEIDRTCALTWELSDLAEGRRNRPRASGDMRPA